VTVMFARTFMGLVLKQPPSWFLGVRLSAGSGTMVFLLRDAAAWCGRILANRSLLTRGVAATLAVEIPSCLADPQHALKRTVYYWDLLQLPSKFVPGVWQAAARLVGRMAAELTR